MKSKRCEWCDHSFQTKISYQIYCSSECREAATKEKISARYQISRIARRAKGRKRFCKSCNTELSIYNEDILCNQCIVNPKDVSKALRDMKGLGLE